MVQKLSKWTVINGRRPLITRHFVNFSLDPIPIELRLSDRRDGGHRPPSAAVGEY